ncbi:MAG: alpha/beta hydrolase [Cyclobacteriaceae bacterium]
MKYRLALLILYFFVLESSCQENQLIVGATDHYVSNEGVKIHYVSKGKGPTILFVHGFPDFWYSWRDQMEALSGNYRVVAVDLRGYNRSDSPEGVDSYRMPLLVSDLASVINDLGDVPVTLVAHDWGAAISWSLAINKPELIRKLVILSVGHPSAGKQAPVDTTKSTYADYFVSDEFMKQLTASWFLGWVTDQNAKAHYRAAFDRSDKEAMINYYKANYPTRENLKKASFRNRNTNLPNLPMPVLVVHGKKDQYLPLDGHAYTWNFVDNEFSMHVFDDAGHFIQQDESEKLTEVIRQFINK